MRELSIDEVGAVSGGDGDGFGSGNWYSLSPSSFSSLVSSFGFDLVSISFDQGSRPVAVNDPNVVQSLLSNPQYIIYHDSDRGFQFRFDSNVQIP